jgi:hypothetical protein
MIVIGHERLNCERHQMMKTILSALARGSVLFIILASPRQKVDAPPACALLDRLGRFFDVR